MPRTFQTIKSSHVCDFHLTKKLAHLFAFLRVDTISALVGVIIYAPMWCEETNSIPYIYRWTQVILISNDKLLGLNLK